jgi:chaperonin GroEL
MHPTTEYADIRPSDGVTADRTASDIAVQLAGDRAASLESLRLDAPPSSLPPRSNVVQGLEHRSAIGSALLEIASTVGRTAGPHGSAALVRDSGGVHFATKDGYTVLKHMIFLQEIATMVLDHARSVSRTLVRRVGDGSTTAVIMANALYQSFDSHDLPGRYAPGAIQAAMSCTADEVSKEIYAAAKGLVTGSQLVQVATIAANNNPEAGSLVAGIYEKYGEEANIFVDISSTDETIIVPEPGYRILRGMAHDAFANKAVSDGVAPTICLLQEPTILVFGGHVGMPEFAGPIMQLGNALLSRGKSYVVVAQSFASEVLDAAAKFRLKSSSIGFLLVDHSMGSRRGQARLGDLCAVVGATYLDPDAAPQPGSDGMIDQEGIAELIKLCGAADRVRSTGTETVFVTPGGRSPGALERASDLSEQIVRVDTGNVAENMAEELDELRSRRRSLMGTEIVLQAGGATQQEKVSFQYLLEDASLACVAALRSGVVEGLGMTAIRLLYGDRRGELAARIVAAASLKTRIPTVNLDSLIFEVLEATEKAYFSAAKTVVENSRLDWDSSIGAILSEDLAIDAMSGTFCRREDTPVLNPSDTDVEILRGAMSIVAMFIGSDQTVLTRLRHGPGLD